MRRLQLLLLAGCAAALNAPPLSSLTGAAQAPSALPRDLPVMANFFGSAGSANDVVGLSQVLLPPYLDAGLPTAFAFTFMGTVIGGGAQMGLNVSTPAGQQLATSTMAEIISSGSGTWLGGLGCSIASVVVQFLAVVLASVALCCVRTVEAPAKAPQEIAATAV